MPPGSVRALTLNPVNPTDPLKVGWARLETSGGNVTVYATYQLRQADAVSVPAGGALSTAAGVLSSNLVTAATIPVYNDLALERFVGFAVANPNASAINLRLTTLNENGTVADPPLTPRELTVPANGQTAIFLHEILPARTTFRGSMVINTTGSQGFLAVALVQNGPLITAVPVINEKAPSVP